MLHSATCICCTVTRSRVQRPIMTNVTWSHFDRSASQLVLGHTTNCIVVVRGGLSHNHKHRKFCEAWTCGFWDMQVDRWKYGQWSLTFRGQSNETRKNSKMETQPRLNKSPLTQDSTLIYNSLRIRIDLQMPESILLHGTKCGDCYKLACSRIHMKLMCCKATENN